MSIMNYFDWQIWINLVRIRLKSFPHVFHFTDWWHNLVHPPNPWQDRWAVWWRTKLCLGWEESGDLPQCSHQSVWWPSVMCKYNIFIFYSWNRTSLAWSKICLCSLTNSVGHWQRSSCQNRSRTMHARHFNMSTC